MGRHWVPLPALVELLEELQLGPHLVHPSRGKAIASARLKNDKGDHPGLLWGCWTP